MVKPNNYNNLKLVCNYNSFSRHYKIDLFTLLDFVIYCNASEGPGLLFVNTFSMDAINARSDDIILPNTMFSHISCPLERFVTNNYTNEYIMSARRVSFSEVYKYYFLNRLKIIEDKNQESIFVDVYYSDEGRLSIDYLESITRLHLCPSEYMDLFLEKAMQLIHEIIYNKVGHNVENHFNDFVIYTSDPEVIRAVYKNNSKSLKLLQYEINSKITEETILKERENAKRKLLQEILLK